MALVRLAAVSSARPSAQPNVPGRGITASYSRRFWGLVVVIGVGAGLGAAALILLLRAVQHLAWDYSSGPFLHAVEQTSSAHRVIVLTIGGVVAGAGVVALARSGTSDVSEALWLRHARLPLLASFARAVHSIVIVALGASLGREAAPQQAGAAIASTLGDRAGLPEWQRRLLVACGAGAGMAAVYNIPFGGSLFALEVLLGTLALPLRAAGARDGADRHRRRVDLRPESTHLPDRRTHHAPVADRVGRDRRTDRRRRLRALHPR